MKKHGVVIDVESEKLYFKKNHCQHEGAPYVNSSTHLELIGGEATPPDHDIDSRPVTSTSSTPSPSPSGPVKRLTILKRSETPQATHSNSEDTKKDENVRRKESTKDIALIGAAAYHLLAKQLGSEVFAISMKDINDQSEKDLRAKDPSHIKRNLRSVSQPYCFENCCIVLYRCWPLSAPFTYHVAERLKRQVDVAENSLNLCD